MTPISLLFSPAAIRRKHNLINILRPFYGTKLLRSIKIYKKEIMLPQKTRQQKETPQHYYWKKIIQFRTRCWLKAEHYTTNTFTVSRLQYAACQYHIVKPILLRTHHNNNSRIPYIIKKILIIVMYLFSHVCTLRYENLYIIMSVYSLIE